MAVASFREKPPARVGGPHVVADPVFHAVGRRGGGFEFGSRAEKRFLHRRIACFGRISVVRLHEVENKGGWRTIRECSISGSS